jgi:DNA-binding transcriptional regulator YiaG
MFATYLEPSGFAVDAAQEAVLDDTIRVLGLPLERRRSTVKKPAVKSAKVSNGKGRYPESGAYVNGIYERSGLKSRAFAERLGFALRTVQDWINGSAQPRADGVTALERFAAELDASKVA